MARQRDRWGWVVAVVAAALLVAAVYFYICRTSLVAPVHELTTRDTERLGFFRDRVNLLLTIATLFLGGGGTFLVNAKTKAQHRWALVALAAAGVSLVFGYLAYDTASWMLDNEFFNLSTTEIAVPSLLQTLTVVTSLVALLVSFFLVAPEKD